MPDFNEILPINLSRLVGTHDCPALIDLRIDQDFAEAPTLIPGSIRHNFKDLEGLIHKLEQLGKNRTIIYCQKGRKISQGVASLLRERGVTSEVLAGGHLGYLAQEFPMVDTRALPALTSGEPTRWVTRHRPKIDRIACPWLIKRFIDPLATFMFVPAVDVSLVAEKFDAIPFDMEGVEFSHFGSKCSFDSFLSKFSIASEPLEQLANIVRAADTGRLEEAPQAAGLLAMATGLSRMLKDDHEQLAWGIHHYDALYRWARDAQSEIHVWPHNGAGAPK